MEGDNRSIQGDLSLNGATSSDTILEGSLFKRSHQKSWLWQERHFVFSSDSTLSYYHKKGAGRPRRSFVISREAGCEVSTLYVSQRQQSSGEKELLYCFKLTWQQNNSETGSLEEHEHMSHLNESGFFRDDSSVGTERSGPGGAGHAHTPSGNIIDEDIDYLFEGYGAATTDCDSPIVSATPSRENAKFDASFACDRSVDSDSIFIGNTASNENKVSNHSSMSATNLSTTAKKKKKRSLFPKSAFKNMTRAASTGSRKSKLEHSIAEELFPATEEAQSLNGMDNMDCSFKRTERVHRMYAEQKMKERDKLRQQYMSKKKADKKKNQKMLMQGTQVAVAASAAAGVAVLTAGVGLVAGLAFVGIGAAAGASSSASVLGLPKRGKRREIIIATASYEDAKQWKSTIDAHLEYENLKETTWGRILFAEGQGSNAFLARELGSQPSGDLLDDRKLTRDKAFLFEPTTQWRPLDGLAVSLLGTGNQGLRIFREERSNPGFRDGVQRVLTNLSVDVEGTTCSPMKAHVVLNTTPLDAFMCIMSYARMAHTGPDTTFGPRSEQATSFRVVESIDDHMDIVHLVFRPLYLFPSWTSPRDFVLVRYWRCEPDGSYVICYESVKHRDCPPIEGYVRGDMHQAYTVSPRTQVQGRKGGGSKFDSMAQECLLTAVVQVDPRGWVPISLFPFVSFKCYGAAFGIAALLQLLDIRDAIDRDRFVAAALDIEPPTSHYHANAYNSETDKLDIQASDVINRDGDRHYDFTYSSAEASKIKDSPSGLPSTPPPFYPEKWAEPDSNSFLVRGPNYKTDHVKINAGQSIGRLLAVDFAEVDSPIYTGMTKHPTERVQLALQKEKILKGKGLQSDVPPFMFVLNIVVPGEPLRHMVFYYAVDDRSEVDGTSGTPTSKLCNEFFFGDSDEFRDKTFKLIPQIVEGNFIVRRAVGSTPAIMGKKLRQLYVKDEENERFFEIVLDCCSSSVAAGVISISLGYAKTLVVDLGFLLEGNDASVLPERIFGCVRIKHPDFTTIRKVLPPPDS